MVLPAHCPLPDLGRNVSQVLRHGIGCVFQGPLGVGLVYAGCRPSINTPAPPTWALITWNLCVL